MATFGDITNGSDTINVSADQALVGKFTLSESADVTSVSIYCKAQSGTANIKGLIYADSAGNPGAKKAVGSVVNITTTAGWAVSTVTVTLPAGDYWLGVVADAGITVNEDAIGGSQTSLKTSFTYASPPDPYGSETSNDDGFQVNAYATYTPTPSAAPTPRSRDVGRRLRRGSVRRNFDVSGWFNPRASIKGWFWRGWKTAATGLTQADLSAAGVGAASYVSGATAGTVYSAAGSGTLADVGAAIWNSALSAAGTAGGTLAPAALGATAYSASGIGTVTGISATVFAGVLSAPGTGALAGVGAATIAGVLSAAGVGAMAAASSAIALATLGAAGVAAGSLVSASVDASTWGASGAAGGGFDGEAVTGTRIVEADLSAIGAGTFSAVGENIGTATDAGETVNLGGAFHGIGEAFRPITATWLRPDQIGPAPVTVEASFAMRRSVSVRWSAEAIIRRRVRARAVREQEFLRVH